MTPGRPCRIAGGHPRSPDRIGRRARGLRPGKPGDTPADGAEGAAALLPGALRRPPSPVSRRLAGTCRAGRSVDDLQDRLEQLFGFPAPPRSGRSTSSPPGLSPYYGSWLDSLMQDERTYVVRLRQAEDQLCLCRRPGAVPCRGEGGTGDRRGGEDPAGSSSPALPRDGSAATASWTSPGFASWTAAPSREALEARLAGAGHERCLRGPPPGDPDGLRPCRLRTARGRPSRSGYSRWAACRPLSGNWYVSNAKGMERDPSMRRSWSKTASASSSGATASSSGRSSPSNCRSSSGRRSSGPSGSWSFPARSFGLLLRGDPRRAVHLPRGVPIPERASSRRPSTG